MKPKNETLAFNLGLAVTFIFFMIWAFGNAEPSKLFGLYIIMYIASILVGFFYPLKDT